MKFILIASVLIATTLASQYVPIQSQYDGIYFGGQGTRLHIEAFYDLLCPDSKASNAILNQVFATTDTSKYHFTYHQFPLPYHAYAFTASIGVKFFTIRYGDLAAIDYVNFVFSIQDTLSVTGQNKTWAQITDEFADKVQQYFAAKGQYIFTKTEFINALNNPSYNIQTRASWKFGTHRGLSGTPMFLVNGVVLDGAESWSYDDWYNFITIRTVGEQVENSHHFLP